MLRKVSFWQHLLVGLAIAVMTLLAGFRLIGAGDESLFRPEHFDAKQVTVWPEGADGVRIREVVDIDFGLAQRRGYQRIVPNDFGVPTDVTASSPDANDDVEVVPLGDETRIRIGDPAVTFTGRHRYILEYTLPDARVSTGALALDIIGNDETFETERFEVVMTGFDFESLDCSTGDRNAFGGCEFTVGARDNQVAVIEPLVPGAGITVHGTIASLTNPAVPDLPDQPDPISAGFRPVGFAMIPLGLLAAGAVFLIGRSTGSNTVFAGGATEAAFGELASPASSSRRSGVATYRVPDSRLAELATTEFVPPRGLSPWQAAVVLRESVDNDTVAAWFSEMIAEDALVATEVDGKVNIARGAITGRLSAVDLGHLQRLFADREVIVLGKYDKDFTATWGSILGEQRSFARGSGWWDRGGPGGRTTMPSKLIAGVLTAAVLVAGVSVVVGVAGASSSLWRLLSAPWVALAAGFFVPFAVAALAYRPMFASRTATGSALALRAESFRRFLAASEGRHVDWAWDQGLLREYSAWAVALGAAEAWSKAIKSSNIADPQVALSGPLLVHSAGSAFASSHTAPSSSSGGGGGGVGGGGGGGSSGSW